MVFRYILYIMTFLVSGFNETNGHIVQNQKKKKYMPNSVLYEF